MPMVCPQCSGTFENALQCPQCNVRLLYQPPHTGEGAGGRWHQTLSGRFLVGLTLALGLCFGLLQLSAAGVRALGPPGLTLEAGVALFLGMQALALVLSGVLTGAGQRQAVTLGVTVGIVSGALAIIAVLSGAAAAVVLPLVGDVLDPKFPVRAAILFALPIVHAVFGGVGGYVGSAIWRPPFDVDLSALASTALAGEARAAAAPPKRLFNFAGPIAWVRVTIGIVIAIVGAVSPRAIIEVIVELGKDVIEYPDPQKTRFLTAEIFSLSILVGGCIAGATTPNGIKQGLCVGIGSGIFMAMFYLTNAQGPKAVLVLLPLFCSVLLGSMGGWFGSELLPPVYTPKKRKKQRSWWFG